MYFYGFTKGGVTRVECVAYAGCGGEIIDYSTGACFVRPISYCRRRGQMNTRVFRARSKGVESNFDVFVRITVL